MKHKYHSNEPDCKACQRTAKRKARDLPVVLGKIAKYNACFERVKPFIENYHKALSKLWGTPIGYEDKRVLEKYGLIENHASTHYHRASYKWSYELKQLNRLLK